MFLKNVKKFIPTPFSIKTTLTILYSLSTLILLSFICVLSSVEMNHILNEKNYRFVSDEVNIISGILYRTPQGYLGLKHEVEEIQNHLLKESIYKYYIRIIDVDKNTSIETKNMQSIFKNANFFTQTSAEADEEVVQNWVSNENKNYFLMRKNIQQKNRKWVVQIGLDTSYEHQRLSEYVTKLVIILFSGVLVSFFLGLLIAKKGMQKLHELTDTAKKVSSASLHKRINPQDWPIELRKLGIAFNQMLDRIEEAFLRLTQFSSDLAHELRTPVNNLLGEIEITLSHTPTSGEYKQVLESNIEEVRRISHTIENLLFLAKAENPKFDIIKTKLNIKNEISLISNYYQSMADDVNTSIVCSGEGEFYGNTIMFRRMISNILSNALKYSLPQKNIFINIIETNKETVQITIQDEGYGIAEEHLPKIFDRFYRVDLSRSQNSGGVGLGLAIVKSIVELHHGTISMVSELGKGTTIKILLPKMTKL